MKIISFKILDFSFWQKEIYSKLIIWIQYFLFPIVSLNLPIFSDGKIALTAIKNFKLIKRQVEDFKMMNKLRKKLPKNIFK